MSIQSIQTFSPEQQVLIDIWEAHIHAEFEAKSVDATLATMIESAHLNNIPTMKTADGLDAIREFYSHSFIKSIPPDTEITLISRTVGQHQLVDEQIFKCTHSQQMDWLLPNIPPTGKMIEIPMVVIIGFRENKVAHEHIYWDQASVLVQVGLLDSNGLPITGAESAAYLLKQTGN